MGFLSLLFGGDGVVRLALPEREEALTLAWLRCAGEPPDEGELAEAASTWVEERVGDPFRARLRRALNEDAMTVEVVPRSSAPDPPMDPLRQFSAPGWEERFARATHVVAVRASADPAWPPVAAWLSLAGAAGIAARTGGLVMDPAVPRFLPHADEERVPGDGRFLLSEHVVSSFSPERGDSGWLTTLGLVRFGLPEVEIRDLPSELAERAAWVAQAIALRVVEAAVAAPAEDDERLVELDEEMALRSSDVAVAQGEEARSGDLERATVVRLQRRSSRRGLGFLSVEPPRGSVVGRRDWLASMTSTLAPNAAT